MLTRKYIKFVVLAIILFGPAVIPAEEETALIHPNDGATLLNPNSASNEELDALPYIDKSEIEAIISGRFFATISALNELLSAWLNNEQLEHLYGKLFVPINLNSASEEDILLIPGINKRMAHEFQEYRPYKSMQQFRREIGKYVNAKEIARLEMYVTLD